jgi:hypothetical protein
LRWRPPAPLSPWAGTRKAAALHKQDHRIRREERIMAGQNGGHITRQEQRTLNQPENAVSREIGK